MVDQSRGPRKNVINGLALFVILLLYHTKYQTTQIYICQVSSTYNHYISL